MIMNTVIQTKQELLRMLANHHAQIKALRVKRLGLFGSFVRNRPHETSEIDGVCG